MMRYMIVKIILLCLVITAGIAVMISACSLSPAVSQDLLGVFHSPAHNTRLPTA
ncbi:MAG: hypothetical protein VB082_01660 [Christensenella sp.]|nr:hypothetical protein [Christensenella sp.]